MGDNDLNKKSGVYQIQCLVNSKVYFGSAVNLKNRFREHRRTLDNGTHRNPRLQNAWNKYGADSFSFQVIEHIPNKNDLIPIEQKYIDQYKSYDSDFGYNLNPTAGSQLGAKRSRESRERMAVAGSGRIASPEAKQKISLALTGRPVSPETRAKIAQAQIGKVITQEAKRKIGEANRGRRHTPEAKAKVSAATKGHVCTPEWRARIGDGNRGKVRKHKPDPSQTALDFPEDEPQVEESKAVQGSAKY